MTSVDPKDNPIESVPEGIEGVLFVVDFFGFPILATIWPNFVDKGAGPFL